MAFLFSSPVLNPIIVALLLSLLGLEVTGLRGCHLLWSHGCRSPAVKIGMETQVKPLVTLQSLAVQTIKLNPRLNLRRSSLLLPLAVLQERTNLDRCPTLPFFRHPRLAARESGVDAPDNGHESCCTATFDANGKPTPLLAATYEKRSGITVDTFKGVFWYLLLGAAIGAFIYGFFPQDLVVRLAGPGNPGPFPLQH
jgi:uncharacterized membrane protein YraQ (UPF0718 family)